MTAQLVNHGERRVTFERDGIACGAKGGAALYMGTLRCSGCGKEQHVMATWAQIQEKAMGHRCAEPEAEDGS